jgi:O-acetyl-ADP-ribose deacetylase (regulator of RNase III)
MGQGGLRAILGSIKESDKLGNASSRNAINLAQERGFRSLAFPVVGSGSGGFSADRALQFLREKTEKNPANVEEVRIVRYKRAMRGKDEKLPSIWSLTQREQHDTRLTFNRRVCLVVGSVLAYGRV